MGTEDLRLTPKPDLPGEVGDEPLEETLLLVGAEGCSELLEGDEPAPWIRYADADDREQFKQDWLRRNGGLAAGPEGLQKALQRLSELFVDHNGRPYWLVAVRSDAPSHVWACAQRNLRVLRLED